MASPSGSTAAFKDAARKVILVAKSVVTEGATPMRDANGVDRSQSAARNASYQIVKFLRDK